MTLQLDCITSIAPSRMVERLAHRYSDTESVTVAVTALGGVDAQSRVAAGGPFDIVVLAEGALTELAGSGHIVAGSITPVALSDSVLATHVHRASPRIQSAQDFLRVILDSDRVGYSTGPSGKALLSILQGAGILEVMRPRLVQAPPGVPVADLIAREVVSIGIQQRSELLHSREVKIVAPLPEGMEVSTVFAAAVSAISTRRNDAEAFIDYLLSQQAAKVFEAEGMRHIGH